MTLNSVLRAQAELHMPVGTEERGHWPLSPGTFVKKASLNR